MRPRKKIDSEAPLAGTECQRCAFWFRDCSDTQMEASDGTCQRQPPTVLMTHDGLVSVWPMTDDVDKCGEFRARMNG